MRKYAFFSGLGNHFRRKIAWVDKLIWPTRSVVTGKQIVGPGLIEPELWPQIRFLDCPVCYCCGTPFLALQEVGDAHDREICGACTAKPPAFDRARAVFVYDDITSRIVLRFKNGGDRSGLKQMGRWFTQITHELIKDTDIVMAVPLHASRLRKRGYNQSLWLAAEIARSNDLTLAHHLLKRKKNTQTQAGKSAKGRKKNVEGAFDIPRRHFRKLSGKQVLLVDDVFTTGSTVEACAKVLRRAGVARVDVVTLARVVSPVDVTI